MNKGGQFYVVAAMLIVLTLAGFSGVGNYVLVNSEPETIEEVARDLSRESYSITEYGLYNDENVDLLLGGFAGEQIGDFFLDKTEDANIIFLYGSKKDLKALQYKEGSQGSINVGGTRLVVDTPIYEVINLGDVSGQEEVEITLLDNIYTFELNDNQIFYFVVVKERGDEVFVKTNKNERDKNDKK